MNCFKCQSEMKCYDDINYDTIRIDFEKCPVCNSKAEIRYNIHDRNISKVIWTEK